MTSISDRPSPVEPFVQLDRNGLIVLSDAECLRLLGQATFGRIAVSVGALPTILPVNYRLVGDRLVFRTTAGSKLDAATSGAVVAFEVDQIEPISHAGWSVIVTGIAAEVTDMNELAEIVDANVPHWAHGRGQRVVKIPTTLMTGRLLVPSLAWDDEPAAARVTFTEATRTQVGFRVQHGPTSPFG